jgi:iron(III) transport system ATP-binding protein
MQSAMADDPLWSLRGVSLGRGRLRNVSLEIPRGVTAVIGWSGAGKTSLLNLLAGFEQPSAGMLRTSADAGALAWVPQSGGLWPHCTARAHLEIAGRGSEGIGGLLHAFDLDVKASARPAELSLGEQSRLAVARALAAKASVLIMDEPLVHVDPARVGKYWSVIEEHLAATGASLIFSTHVPEVVLGRAQHVICLRAGEVLHEGAANDLYERPATPELMNFLGAGNWLRPDEMRLWLNVIVEEAVCIRPEQLAIEPGADGPFAVEAARFCGSIAEAKLHSGATGIARTFFHRPPAARLTPGVPVWLRLLLIFCLACGLGTACQRSPNAAPIIDVRAWESWILPPDGATLPTPRSVAAGPNDEIAVLDTAGRVLLYTSDGTFLRQWKMLDVSVGKPEGIVILKDGRIVVCDTHYHRIVFFDQEGRMLQTFGRLGKGPGEFIYPVGVTKDAAENLYICEYGGHDRVQKFTREGAFLLEFGSFGTASGQFQRPSGLAWHEGRIFVTDAVNSRVLIFSDAGPFLGLLGEPGAPPLVFNLPYDIALGRDGYLYVIEYGAGRLARVSLDGRLVGQYGRSGSGEGEFATPWGLTIDSRLRVRIADTKNRRVVTLHL